MKAELRENLSHLLSKRGPLLISALITLLALGAYYATFIGERPTPLSEYVQRMELASLDARFQLRGKTEADPRIVIVDVDQHAQEVLGRWPFPRSHFAHMLDVLREGGARVVVFDVTFSQPDDAVEPIHRLQERLQGGGPRDPALARHLKDLEEQYDHDARFAAAIERFGSVVLGNFFLYSQADLQGLSAKALERFANLAAYHPFPQVRAAQSARGPESYANLVRIFDDRGMLPRGAEANLEALTLALPETSATGFFNVFADPDGVVRRAQLALPFAASGDPAESDLYASIDVHAVRFFLGLPNERVVLNFGEAGVENIELGEVTIQVDGLARAYINYRGPARTYPYYSLGKVVRGEFPPGAFRDKIVLVGASATGIGDLRVTPFAALDFPGVEIHANTIDNMLHGDFLQRGAAQALVDVGLIVLFGVPLGLALGLLPARWMAAGLLLLIPFLGGVYWAFLNGWWLNVTAPAVLTLIPNTGLLALHRVLVEERERRRTRAAFQQYISPEVIRRLLKSPESVRPRKTEITTLFSDIRGFTSLSEQLDAQEVAVLLNQYLGEMTGIVFRTQGTLDKYIGDAVMAFWGAPFEEGDHAAKGCRAALTMVETLVVLQGHWEAEGKPKLEIGIGLNTGIASVGNMGSNRRTAYTAIGDSVNLASRLEGMNKVYGTRIIVSETTRGECPGGEFIFRELDWIRVKGKTQPVRIYELTAFAALPADWPQRVRLFEEGLCAYRAKDWTEAAAHFGALLQRWPDDGPARVFLERCEEYATETPGEEWDGIYVAKTK
jgi:adenylate cyclase